MNVSVNKKIVAISLVLVMLFAFSGCSEFLQEIAIEKVTDYMTETLEDFISDPVSTCEENSLTEVVFTELTEEQMDLALRNMSDVSFSVKKIKINEERNKAEVNVVFKNVYDFYEDTSIIGTADEIDEYFSECDVMESHISFNVVRQEKGGWMIKDMSLVDEVFFAPYVEICFLDDEGLPINITSGYVNSIFVDSYWYDPLQSDPIVNATFTNALYMQHVFYFNQPMTMVFTCELRRDDEVIDSYELALNQNVIASCDFENNDGSAYASGTYTIALVCNGNDIVVSSPATVR